MSEHIVGFDHIIVAAGPGCTTNITVACSACGATVTDWRKSERDKAGLLPNQARHAAFHESFLPPGDDHA